MAWMAASDVDLESLEGSATQRRAQGLQEALEDDEKQLAVDQDLLGTFLGMRRPFQGAVYFKG